MSEQTPEEPRPAAHARESRPLKILGAAIFGVGLLTLAGGILLAIMGLLSPGTWFLLIGTVLAILGLALNVTGLVLLYRAIAPAYEQPTTPADRGHDPGDERIS